MKTVMITATMKCHPATDTEQGLSICAFASTEMQRLADYFARDGHVLIFEATMTNTIDAEGDETA